MSNHRRQLQLLDALPLSVRIEVEDELRLEVLASGEPGEPTTKRRCRAEWRRLPERTNGLGRWAYRAARAGRGRAISAARSFCTVTPIGDAVIAVGDIVLCRVKGNQYLHLVKAIQGERFQIGNNRGGINGWVTHRQIFGRLTEVE